jgi:dTDP-glucose 4,6-dehydratase
MSKRVLVTGFAGSIGVHVLCHIMTNTDWVFVGTDSLRHKGLSDRVAMVLEAHPDWRPRLEVIVHDLTAPFSAMTIKKMGKIDYIINLASLSDVQASIDDPVPFVRNNVEIALNTLELARVLKPQVFVQITTDEVFGPSSEDYRCAEWDPIVPSNPYSASKAAQECFAIAYWRTYGVPLMIVTFMNQLGECQQGGKFPVIVQRKVMAGETVQIHGTPGNIGSRYYLHSRNGADALLWLLRNVTPNLHQEGQIDRPFRVNVVGDAKLDNLELAQMIAGMLGKPLHYEFVGASDTRPGHDASYSLCGNKLRELGWTAPVPFEESLRNVIEWQIQHPEWLDV